MEQLQRIASKTTPRQDGTEAGQFAAQKIWAAQGRRPSVLGSLKKMGLNDA